MAPEALLAPRRLVPGYRFDRYELLCSLSEGGMGEVWIARKHGTHGFQKLFAVKTILLKFADDERFRAMFLEEARIASRITHPNVAHIFDLGEHEGLLYLVMEFVDGPSLKRLASRALREDGGLPTSIVLHAMMGMCAGLHAAHELRDDQGEPLGVVHRDATPHNLLVSRAGEVKLVDFGIAKARDRLVKETTGGVLKGKLHYAAPEQATGADLDRRADVWTVGVSLYELLAHRNPFEASNDIAFLKRLIGTEPPDPLPDDVPEPLARVILKCLERDPERRYASAADLGDALATVANEIGETAKPIDLAEHVRLLAGAQLEQIDEAVREGSALLDLRAAAPEEQRTLAAVPRARAPSVETPAPMVATALDDARRVRRLTIGALLGAGLLAATAVWFIARSGGAPAAPATPPAPSVQAAAPAHRGEAVAPPAAAAASAAVAPMDAEAAAAPRGGKASGEPPKRVARPARKPAARAAPAADGGTMQPRGAAAKSGHAGLDGVLDTRR